MSYGGHRTSFPSWQRCLAKLSALMRKRPPPGVYGTAAISIGLLGLGEPTFAQSDEGDVRPGILLKHGAPHEIRYKVEGGRAIYQGDVDLGPADEVQRQYELLSRKDLKFAQIAKDNRWPGAVVYFRFHSSVDPQSAVAQRIHKAIDDWEKHTVLRFEERKDTQTPYIVFEIKQDLGKACGRSTSIGMLSPTAWQAIYLEPTSSDRCILHEIGHAVGLFHEHTRCDRDKFINIVWDNVSGPSNFHRECALSEWESWWEGRPEAYRSGPYDYASIMHYHDKAFAKDNTKRTIIAPKPIGLDKLSAGDIEAINAMYVKWAENIKIPDYSANDRSIALVSAWGALHMFHVDSGGFINHSTRVGEKWISKGRISNSNGIRLTTGESVAATLHNNKIYVAFADHERTPKIAARTEASATWDEQSGVVERSPNNITRRVWTASAPAIASYKGILWIVYRNEDSDDLYYSRLMSSGLFSNPIQLPTQKTRNSPALATFNGLLHLVHRGKQLAKLYHSTFDSILWSENREIRGHASLYNVALATFDKRLHMVHTGGSEGTQFNLYYTFFGPDGTWRPSSRIPGQYSQRGRVSIAGFGNCLFRIHQGKSTNDLWFSSLFSLDDPNASIQCN